MACEVPAVSAVVARLANPQIELAAYGSVIYPVVLVIEAPIIMLLSASTALSRDRASYVELRRFANLAGLILTLLHLSVALTPAYDVIVLQLLGAPAPVAEAARVGLLIMTPWTWAIAYRRFNQGVLIRFGHNEAVTVGTAIRLGANLAVLAIGWSIGSMSGAVIASSAVACGVTAEAIYSGVRVRPVVHEHLQTDDPEHTPLRGAAFWRFYVPLALTPIITLIVQPLASAAIARMPAALLSLAVIPVVIGLLFMFQALGLAMTEVVVAGLERGSTRSLLVFSRMLALVSTIVLTLIAITPLSGLWFGTVSGLTPAMVEVATVSLVLGIPIAGTRVMQSWYAGVLVHARRTQAISEAVVAFLIVALGVFAVGIVTQRWIAAYVAIVAYSLGRIVQTLWLWWRSRDEVRALVG